MQYVEHACVLFISLSFGKIIIILSWRSPIVPQLRDIKCCLHVEVRKTVHNIFITLLIFPGQSMKIKRILALTFIGLFFGTGSVDAEQSRHGEL